MGNLYGVPEAKTECRKCKHLKHGRYFYLWYCCKTQKIRLLEGSERVHINEVGCMSFEPIDPAMCIQV